MAGDKIGSYRVTHKICEGGMGAVYEAVLIHDAGEFVRSGQALADEKQSDKGPRGMNQGRELTAVD